MKSILRWNFRILIILFGSFVFGLLYCCYTYVFIQSQICHQQNDLQEQNLLLDLQMLQPTEKKIYTPCPAKISNNHYYNPKKWASIENTIDQIQQKWLSYITSIDEYPLGKFKGRGIVTTGASYIYARLYASLRLLRAHKSQLPVEIFTFAGELNEEQRTRLQQIDHVRIRLMKTNDSLRDRDISRYAIKPHAILQSSFEHVLWLDADNIPVHNPDYLFDLPHYTRSSAIFWPDFWSSSNDNPIWKILKLTCRAEDYEQESGEILINKKRSWKGLHLAKYLVGDKDIMKLILGDKDTFRLAWKALNVSFYFIRKYPALAGFYFKPLKDYKSMPHFCGHTMIQHDPFGKILFMHGTLLKYIWKSQFSVERKYPELANLSNPWRVLVQYANTASYFRPQMIGTYGYVCMKLPTGENEHYPPLLEDDFHTYISPNTTAMYLRFLLENNSDIHSDVSSIIL